MKIRFAILVEFEVEDLATTNPPDENWAGYTPTRRDAADYVRDAVSSWGGQYPPTHPFFPRNMKIIAIR
jgi:hypothetical protein